MDAYDAMKMRKEDEETEKTLAAVLLIVAFIIIGILMIVSPAARWCGTG